MERNRESRRAGSTPFQPAGRRSRTKDASDDADRLDDAVDTRVDSQAWERQKERLTTFPLSVVPNPREKRKHHAFSRESQASGLAAEDAAGFVQETDAEASQDDELPHAPLHRRLHSKESDTLMDIRAVPRKARSSICSSSRFSSKSDRHVEPHSAEILLQKGPAVMDVSRNEISSPSTLKKLGKKLKPLGFKVLPTKPSKPSEYSTISDQEAEVAEALFVLARSVPSYSGMLESEEEVKLEPISSLHPATNGYSASYGKDTTGPTAEAPKQKCPRLVVKHEDGRVSTNVRLVDSGAVSSSACASGPSHPSVGEREPDYPSEKPRVYGVPLLKVKASTDISLSAISQRDNADSKVEPLDNENMKQDGFKVPKPEIRSNSEVGVEKLKMPAIANVEDVNVGCDGLLMQDPRTGSVDKIYGGDRGIPKLKFDLMASSTKHLSNNEEGQVLSGKQVMRDDTLMNSTGHNAEAHMEVETKVGVEAIEADKGLLKTKEKCNGEEHDTKQDKKCDDQQKEMLTCDPGKEQEEGDKDKDYECPLVETRFQNEDPDNGLTASFPSTSSTAAMTSPPVLAGWMGGLPPLGSYYGPGATPWAAGSPIPTPNLIEKTANSAVQLPHSAIVPPVRRMKHCATHVYVAHFIHREQQLSCHSLWSAALCGAAPYNFNVPWVSMLDNKKLAGHFMDATGKASAQQSGPSSGYTMSQFSGAGAAVSSSTVGGDAMCTISAFKQANGVDAVVESGAGNSSSSGTGAGIGAGTASGNMLAAHAQQYLATMMPQNGFASFPFPFSGPPTQGAQFFNNPFFAPHLMVPLPYLQPGSNIQPVQKQLQGLPPSSSAQQLVPGQQHLQLQLAPQVGSPSQSQPQQQLNHGAVSTQHHGIVSEKESTVGSESFSTAESRLIAMQRTICGGQASSNLPNLNISPSSSMLGVHKMSAMPSHKQDMSPNGVKQASKLQQQFQGLNPTSSMQQLHFLTQSTGSGGLESNRASLCPGSLDLASGGSMIDMPAQGVLLRSSESAKNHAQQQQSHVGQSQQLPSSFTRPLSVGVDDSEKQTGAPLISRVDEEALSPSLQGSPTSTGDPPSARLTGNGGCTPSSGASMDVRSCRPASSGGTVQAPVMLSLPMKQAVVRSKPASGTSVTLSPTAQFVATYADRVLPGRIGKFAGSVPPFSGQTPPTSQAAKPSPSGIVKVGPVIALGPTQQPISSPGMCKVHGQQAQGNQQGVPTTAPRMLAPVSASTLPSGTISSSCSHTLSTSKGPVLSAVKSPSNGKGTMAVVKSGPSTKKPRVSGPVISAARNLGQKMSVRPPVQQKISTSVHASQFPLLHSVTTASQQRVPAKNSVYSQLQPQQGQYKQPLQQQALCRPQLFLEQHQQQFIQQPSTQQQQQQAASPPTPLLVPHHYASNSPNTHGQTPQHSRTDAQMAFLQQQSQSAAASEISATNTTMDLSSPNLILGTAGGMPEIITSGHPSVSGQVSSPHSASSPYLLMAPVKSTDQKPLDVTKCETPQHQLSSLSQAAVVSNPTST